MIQAHDQDFIWVHFNGDVAVGPTVGTVCDGKIPIAVLSLQNLNGKFEPGEDIKDVNSITGPRVRLTFTRLESIDVVMAALEEAKKRFQVQLGDPKK